MINGMIPWSHQIEDDEAVPKMPLNARTTKCLPQIARIIHIYEIVTS